MLTQASDPAYGAFVENVMWMESQVVVSALNVPGSNNDLVPWTNLTPAQAAQQAGEFNGRLRADLLWLQQTFQTAIANNAKGVVLAIQADMWDPAEADLSGYDVFVQRLAGMAKAFGRPVLLFNGDSHVYQVDHPLTAGDPFYGRHRLGGLSAPNVTRITVEGSMNRTEYVRLTVDPASPSVFTWVRVPI